MNTPAAFSILQDVLSAAEREQLESIDALLAAPGLATSSRNNKRSITIKIDAVTVTLTGWREGDDLHFQAGALPERVFTNHFGASS